MKKLLTTLATLTMVAAPASAAPFQDQAGILQLITSDDYPQELSHLYGVAQFASPKDCSYGECTQRIAAVYQDYIYILDTTVESGRVTFISLDEIAPINKRIYFYTYLGDAKFTINSKCEIQAVVYSAWGNRYPSVVNGLDTETIPLYGKNSCPYQL
jgi:hypothetical protein